MVPSNVQLPNSNFSQSFRYQDFKDHEEVGGSHLGEIGDYTLKFDFFFKSFSYVAK